MKFTLLIVAVAVAVGADAFKVASTLTAEQQVDGVMAAVENHCAVRRRRDIDQSSQNDVRRIVLNIIKDCLEEPSPTPTYPPIEGPCASPNTHNLTEYWRKDNEGSDHKLVDGYYNCDGPLFDNTQWFRITGHAGKVIRNTCSPSYSCGSHGGLWTNATMPAEIGQILQLPLYGSWGGNCDWYPFQVDNPLTVQRCSSAPGDFVYKINAYSSCYHSVCTMD